MKTFRELVGEAIGEASMCWSETPKGVFDSTRAAAIVDRILTSHDALEKRVRELKELMRWQCDSCDRVCCEGCRVAHALARGEA